MLYKLLQTPRVWTETYKTKFNNASITSFSTTGNIVKISKIADQIGPRSSYQTVAQISHNKES